MGNADFAEGRLLYFQDRSLMARPFDPDRLQFIAPALPVVDQELDQDWSWNRTPFSVSRNGVMLFQSAVDANSELVWFLPDGTQQGRLADSGALYPRFSPDGRFVALSSDEAGNGKHVLRVHDLQRGVTTRLTNDGEEGAGVWSRDGAKIAYASTHLPGRIYEIRADGAGEPALILEGPRVAPNDYSPDGRYLAHMTFEKGPPNQMVLDTVERKSIFVSQGGEGQFSPDGKWLAYTSQPGVFVQPFPLTGARMQIFSNASQPRWSHDGKKLYFVVADRKLMEAPIAVSGGTLTPGAAKLLFQTRITMPRFTLHQYDVTPDDSRFLINSLRPEAPLTLLTNWPSLLQK